MDCSIKVLDIERADDYRAFVEKRLEQSRERLRLMGIGRELFDLAFGAESSFPGYLAATA